METIVDIIGAFSYTFVIFLKIVLWMFGLVSFLVGVSLVSTWTYGIYLALRKALRESALRGNENK